MSRRCCSHAPRTRREGVPHGRCLRQLKRRELGHLAQVAPRDRGNGLQPLFDEIDAELPLLCGLAKGAPVPAVLIDAKRHQTRENLVELLLRAGEIGWRCRDELLQVLGKEHLGALQCFHHSALLVFHVALRVGCSVQRSSNSYEELCRPVSQ